MQVFDLNEVQVMAKQNSIVAARQKEKRSESKSHIDSRSRKCKKDVEVVTCPSAFPVSGKTRPSPSADRGNRLSKQEHHQQQQQKRPDQFLDWHHTHREIRALGATGFVGKQKRNFEEEQYQILTGRPKKKHKVPLPIVRGTKKKAAERQAREEKEAREAGVVLPRKQRQEEKKIDSTSRIHGPAPSIGFVKNGVFRVKSKR